MARTLRVPVALLTSGELTLDEAASRYVARVHRLEPGDSFLAFDPAQALEGDATVIASSGKRVTCQIGPLRSPQKRPARHVTLIYGLAKGDKIDQVIRDATALGVAKLVLVECERSVVRYADRDPKREKRWLTIATESARQAGRGDLPVLVGPVSYSEAIAAGGQSLKLCCDPASRVSLRRVLAEAPLEAAVELLIGPEGGLSPREIEEARGLGFESVCIAPFTLRTETAVVAALGAVFA